MKKYDVIVIGGGAAGLSGAMALARSRRSVLVIDDATPRNAPAEGVHNYLTRDGIPPSELTAIGRQEVIGYGGEVVTGTVTTARRDGDFTVGLADGTTYQGRRLLVTTGLADVLPDVPGLAERWGKDVLHCPYCHGWEVRDQAIGVLATSAMALHQVQMFRQLSDDITLFLHTAPELTEEQWEELAARGIAVVQGKGRAARGGGRQADRSPAGGRQCHPAAGSCGPDHSAGAGELPGRPRSGAGRPRGQRRRDRHAIPVDARGATEVPGVFAAGNVTDPMAQVMSSAAAGLMTRRRYQLRPDHRRDTSGGSSAE